MKGKLICACVTVFALFLSAPAGAQTPPYFLLSWGSNGSGPGQFNNPFGVAVDSLGNVYVTDYGNHRVQKFTSAGVFLAEWGSLGSGDGDFSYPQGIAFDSRDNVYVSEGGNHRIQKFTSAGTFLDKWGSLGSGNGQFLYPVGIAVDGRLEG